MKKRELRNRMGLSATPYMIRLAKQEQTIEIKCWRGTKIVKKYEVYARADVQKGILALYLWNEVTAKRGDPDPELTVYMDREKGEFITFSTIMVEKKEMEKWLTAKLEGLYRNRWINSTKRVWVEKESQDVIRKYFKKTGDAFDIIKDWQEEVGKKKLEEKHKKEKKKIDDRMRVIPEMPKRVAGWIREEWAEHFMFYNRKRDVALCTSCRREMAVSDVELNECQMDPWEREYAEDEEYRGIRHMHTTTCPGCYKRVMAISWNRRKKYVTTDHATVLQKLKDGSGWVVRNMNVTHEYRQQNGEWNMIPGKVWEYRRILMDWGGSVTGLYEWDTFKNTEEVRWCRMKLDFYVHFAQTNRVYPENLEEAVRGTAMEHLDWQKYLRKLCIPSLFRRMLQIPGLEYIQKSGMNRLEEDLILNYSAYRQEEQAKNAWEYIGLNRNQLERLKRVNGGMILAGILRRDEKISQDCLERMRKSINESYTADTLITCAQRVGLSIEKMFNYMEKSGRLYSEYRDYIQMAEDQGLPIRDDIVRRPKNLRQAHDRLVNITANMKNKERQAIADRKFKNIKKNAERNKKTLEWETEEYIIFPAAKAGDLIREGAALHHCVGSSDTYLKKMDTDTSFICFLRRKSARRTPYYTLEVGSNGKIIQWYSKFDRKPDEKIIEPIIQQYEQECRRRMEEMKWSS